MTKHQHCCQRMQDQLNWTCPDHEDPSDCADSLVSYGPKSKAYGLRIHDGGSSSVTINFCPWCGSRLPASTQDR